MVHQPSSLETSKQRIENKFKEIRRDYYKLFSTPEGKRILEDLALSCNVHRTSFDSDALQMAYNEGRREVYLHLVSMSKEVNEEELEKQAKT